MLRSKDKIIGHWSLDIVDGGSVDHDRLHTKGQFIIGLAAGSRFKIESGHQGILKKKMDK